MSYKLLTGAATAGNANMEFLVPAQKQYKLLYGAVRLTTDATVANRRVLLGVFDDAGTPALVFDVHSGAVVVASQTDVHHGFMQGIYRETAFIDNALQVPIGRELILLPGWLLRVWIQNGVAGDSYTGKFMIDEE